MLCLGDDIRWVIWSQIIDNIMLFRSIGNDEGKEEGRKDIAGDTWRRIESLKSGRNMRLISSRQLAKFIVLVGYAHLHFCKGCWPGWITDYTWRMWSFWNLQAVSHAIMTLVYADMAANVNGPAWRWILTGAAGYIKVTWLSCRKVHGRGAWNMALLGSCQGWETMSLGSAASWHQSDLVVVQAEGSLWCWSCLAMSK